MPELPLPGPRRRSRARLAALVALVAVVAGCGGSAASPAPPSVPSMEAVASTPSPTATPVATPKLVTPAPTASPPPVAIPPLDQAFRSPTMGYTVHYPTGWTTTGATEAWRPGDSDFWDEPNGDRIESADAGFRGGSLRLPAGQTAADWIAAYLADQPPCGEQERIPLGGSQAAIALNGCRGLGRLGGRVYDVVVGVGDRLYNFTMEGAVDRAFLMAMLSTITFDPGSATD